MDVTFSSLSFCHTWGLESGIRCSFTIKKSTPVKKSSQVSCEMWYVSNCV